MKWFVVVWKTHNHNHAAAVRIPVFKDTKPKEEAMKIICAKFGYLKKPSSMLATEAPFEYVQRHVSSSNTYF